MSTSQTTASRAAAMRDHSGELSHGQIRTILIGLMAGMFLAALDQTIVSTAIRTIGDDLHGLQIQAWVTTAYLITSTITTPLYGKLSDIYGRRPLFLIAISVFVIGSAACSFSTSMYMLAGFRAFQGLGAGGLFSLALAILADIVSPRERAKYQGYFLAVFGTSSVLGPLVGGALAGANTILWISGWRWVFLVNVPIGIVALILVARFLHVPHFRRDHRIDWWGATALIVCLVPLLIVAEQGQAWGWGSARVLLLIALGVAGLVAFIVVEFLMKDEALIPMRLFRGTFSLGMVANAVIGMGLFGAVLVLPLYMQIARGASPTKSGLLMLPLTIGLMLGSVVSGQLTSRTGRYKIFPLDRHPALRGGRLLHADPQGRHVVARFGSAIPGSGSRLGVVYADPAHGRPERGAGAGYRRRHVVSDVLPADRRHRRRGRFHLGALRPAGHHHPDRVASSRESGRLPHRAGSIPDAEQLAGHAGI